MLLRHGMMNYMKFGTIEQPISANAWAAREPEYEAETEWIQQPFGWVVSTVSDRTASLFQL